jgi:hypothetical protein
MWTNIYIQAGKPSHVARAATYLIRSKASPLTIILNFDKQSANHADIQSACEIINPHVDRWQELYIESDWRQGLFRCIQSIPNITAPFLRHIEIDLKVNGDDVEHNIVPNRTFAMGAPRLTSIRLKGVGLQCFLPPLASTKILHIDEPLFPMTTTCEEFCSMLGRSSALTHMVIGGDVIENWMPNVTLDLPSLRFLAIRVYDAPTIPALLIAISAPKLESMVLESVIEPDLAPLFRTLHTAARPKYPLLRSLTLCEEQAHGFTPSTWSQLMQAFPTITHFTLSYHTIDEFFLALQQTDPNSSTVIPPWPDLNTLTLSDYNLSAGADVRPTLLPPTILARIAIGHPIQKLRLSKSILRHLRSRKQLVGLRGQVAVEQFLLYPDSDNLITWRSGRVRYSDVPSTEIY